jgi:hypothetical protein
VSTRAYAGLGAAQNLMLLPASDTIAVREALAAWRR